MSAASLWIDDAPYPIAEGETLYQCITRHLGPDAVCSNDDRRAFGDFVERIDGLDPLELKLGDDALVVYDLAERVRPFAGSGGFLRLVDCLAYPIAEPGA